LGGWVSWLCNVVQARRDQTTSNKCLDRHSALRIHKEQYTEILERRLERCSTNLSTSCPSSRSTSSSGNLDAVAQQLLHFPGYDSQNLQTCRLRVDTRFGAGLCLEATRFGYLVDQVEEHPGQEGVLQTGKVIVCIGTCALVGLEEAELETRFASCFHNDVLLHVVEWADLCATEIEHEAAMLGEWHENEDAEREQNAMFQAASPFLREQTGAVELLVTLDGEVSITALEKLRADVATSLHSSHPSLHVSPSATGSIMIRGDVMAIRGVLKKLENLIQQCGATFMVEDELFIKMLNDENRLLLSEDLCVLGQRFGIVADLCCPPNEDDSIVLVGDPARMRCATRELKEVLSFHGVEPTGNDRFKDHNACAVEDTLHEAEDLELESLKLHGEII